MTRQRGDDGIALAALVVPECSDTERRKVALLVAFHGHDMDDRRHLLRMLGLWEPVAPPAPPHPLDGQERPVGPVLDRYGAIAACTKEGHPMTTANTLWKRNGRRQTGWRSECRQCANAYKRRRRTEGEQP